MSYGPNFNDMYRYVAFYVDKILQRSKSRATYLSSRRQNTSLTQQSATVASP